MRPIVIGLAGRAGSGKTSLAKYLCKKHKLNQLAFAAPLKKMAMDLWDFSQEQVYGPAEIKEKIDERWGISPREAMQDLGETARDHLGEDVWIRRVLNVIEPPGSVIEDVRYVNESVAISRGIGYVWRLHCIDSPAKPGAHSSEVEVDMIPSEHVFCELRSSRKEGLSHLFKLADEAWKDMRRASR